MKFKIVNFRSIKQQQVEIAPITVVYGPNGAGKSSLFYALLSLKNLVLNPTQNPNGFFNYTFASLGSFEAVAFDHQKKNDIRLEVAFEVNGSELSYRATIGETKGRLGFSYREKNINLDSSIDVQFPYPANQKATAAIQDDLEAYNVTWNGITAQVQPTNPTAENQQKAQILAGKMNSPIELLRKIGMIPLKRGFSKPHYSAVSVSPMLITEDEVATALSNDKYLISKVSFYLEEILGRDFRVHFQPGTAVFSLDATDKKTGIATELVNEGFGVNQIVYFLARCLPQDVETICAEEPEIHLHPSAVRALAKAIIKIVKDEGKQFIISTHSEAFLTALLSEVASGKLEASDLSCYYAYKEKKETIFERQQVNEKGQIEGGLRKFIEAELEDIRNFLNASK